MNHCSKCLRPTHCRDLCQAHYRADLRRRHAQGEHVRPYAQPQTTNMTDLIAFIQSKKETANA